MRLVLDTNIYIDFAKGEPEVVDALAEFGDEIYMPSAVIAELSYGFMKGSRQEANEKKLQEIIDSLDIRIINADRDVARKYTLIYHHLVEKGRKIPINDVWIAASCLAIGGTMITRDKHFLEITMIDLFSFDTD